MTAIMPTWFTDLRCAAMPCFLPGRADRPMPLRNPTFRFNVSVHDPSVIKVDDLYYVFGSHLAARVRI